MIAKHSAINPARRDHPRASRIVLAVWCCSIWLAFAPVRAQEALVCPDFDSGEQVTRNEIGVNLFSCVHFPYDPVYPHPDYSRMSIVNGIAYRRRLRNNALRASADVFRDYFDAKQGVPSVPGYFSAGASAIRTDLRFGFERQFNSRRFRPYAAIDVVAMRDVVRLNGEGRGGFVASGSEPEPYQYTYSSMRYGTSASLGLYWRFSKRFSCSAEGGAWLVLIDDDAIPYSARARVYVDVLRSFAISYTWPK